jgi:NitT/TauT family transport system permease protein
MSAIATPAPRTAAARTQGARRTVAYGAIGVLGALALWQLAVLTIENLEFRASFAPLATFRALAAFVASRALVTHVVPSLGRVAAGMAIATAIGIPVGVLIGYFRTLHQVTNTVFQFGRMTSPLAWMPIAIIVFGVGNRPVVFLIAAAALWPILMNTANGVRNVDITWMRVVRMLGATRPGVLRRVIVPAVLPDMLVGMRISLGVSWIVLVPAEMLGVPSGLGYYILDARDRFNYSELMALILVVGFLGYVTDTLLAVVQRRFSWRVSEEESES